MIGRITRGLAEAIAFAAAIYVTAVVLWKVVGVPREVAVFPATFLVVLFLPQGYGRVAWRRLRGDRRSRGDAGGSA